MPEGRALQRRSFLGAAASVAVGCLLPHPGFAAGHERTHSLFDGSTLRGWIDSENNATSVSADDIADLHALAKAIAAQASPPAAFVFSQLDAPLRARLSAVVSPQSPDFKAVRSALARALTQIVRGPDLSRNGSFAAVPRRQEAATLFHHHRQGRQLAELNRWLLSDAFPFALSSPRPGWTVKDGALASTGAGRGVLYTAHDYRRFRLFFTMRHVSGHPDHQACVLIFCTRPTGSEMPLDALGGIQFQVPRGGHWDYRPGRNTAGGPEFQTLRKVDFDPHQWSRVEIVADAQTGTARMTVAQPVGSPAVEVLAFRDPTAGRTGPIALQMHNAGLFDEYKDLSIVTDH